MPGPKWYICQTFIILFAVTEEKSTMDDSVTVEMQEIPEDAELKFAQGIIEADLDAVNHGLKTNQLKCLDISKIKQGKYLFPTHNKIKITKVFLCCRKIGRFWHYNSSTRSRGRIWSS